MLAQQAVYLIFALLNIMQNRADIHWIIDLPSCHFLNTFTTNECTYLSGLGRVGSAFDTRCERMNPTYELACGVGVVKSVAK